MCISIVEYFPLCFNYLLPSIFVAKIIQEYIWIYKLLKDFTEVQICLIIFVDLIQKA